MKSFKPNLNPLDKIERASRDELINLQLKRMQWSLNHCYKNIPFYKEKFDEIGIHPTDLKTLSDLSRFPFTMKNDLRKNYPTKMFARPMKDVVRIHASSGTTGKPTVVGYSQKDINDWAHCMARSIRATGGDENSVVHISYGYGLFTGGLGAHYGAEKLGAMVIPVSGGMTERQLLLIQDIKPDFIMATPSYFLNLIEQAHKLGYDPKKWSLQVGIFGAEVWTESVRDYIEAHTATKAINIYGLSEIMGPGVAQECFETQDNLTVWEDYFYPEIIDPETGEVLPDGKEGELVFTTLTKEVSPLIRYRTRDLTRILPPTCRTMRRIDRIKGRSDDMLIIRGVNIFPSQIEELILSIPDFEPVYQVQVIQEKHLNDLHIFVELRPGGNALQAGTLQHKIKGLIGVSCKVIIEPNGSIPRSQGKAVRVK